MATESSPIERVKGYFITKGMQDAGTLSKNHSESNCLIFSGTGVLSAVRVLREEELSTRNSVLEAVLSSATLINRVNQVYLALPRLVSSTIESKIMEEYGIGLIVYDQKNVEEVVAPRYFQTASQHTIVASENEDSHRVLVEEIDTLRGRLRSLEEAVESLRSEVEYLRSWKPQAPREETVTSSSVSPRFEGAPSFLRDNPWIEVLSRRGREGERLVS